MGLVTETGNFITDLMRQSAVGWLTSQAGGNCVDGFGKRKVTNMMQRSYFDGTLRANTLGWNTGADVANGATTTLTQVTDGSFSVDAGNIAQIAFHRPAAAGWSYVAAALVQPVGGPFVKGLKYTVSFYVYVSAGTAQQMYVEVEDPNGVNVVWAGSTFTPTGSVQRLSFTFTALLSGNIPNFWLGANVAGAGDVTLRIAGVQVEPGTTMNTYIPTQGTTIVSQAQGTDDGSTGNYEGYTNLFRRGQCDSTTDLNNIGSGVSFALSTSDPAPWSPQSFVINCDGTAAGQGVLHQSGAGQAAVAGSFCLARQMFRGVAGASYAHRTRIANTDTSSTDGTETIFTATGDWQELIPIPVAVAVGKTGDKAGAVVRINGTRTEFFQTGNITLCFSAAGGKQVCPPYLPTTGGNTQSIGNGGLSTPVYVTDVQGWVAIRIRLGWSAAGYSGLFPQVWTWLTDSANRLNILWNSSSNTWAFDKRIAGVAHDANTAVQSHNAGDFVTLIGYWTATEIAISINGGAFNKVSFAGALTPSGSTMGIAATPTDSQVMWFACGKGTLADADAATLNALGNTDPALGLLGAAAQTTMVWDAKTSVDNAYVDGPVTNDLNGTTTWAGSGVVYNFGGGSCDGSGTLSGSGVLYAKGGKGIPALASFTGSGTVYEGGGYPFFADTLFSGSGTKFAAGGGVSSGLGTFTGGGDLIRPHGPRLRGRITKPRSGAVKNS